MKTTARLVSIFGLVAAASCMSLASKAGDATVRIDTHMDPPRWATL
jgi:hypothetical protein